MPGSPEVFLGPDGLQERLESPLGTVLLDVTLELPPATFDGDHRHASGLPTWWHGHIPGSIHVDVATELSNPTSPLHFTHPTVDQLNGVLSALGITPESRVVAYDAGDGLWAARTWYLLRWVGVPCQILAGGLRAWIDWGFEVCQQPAATPAAGPRWTPQTVRPAWLEAAEILADRDRGTPLVCALGEQAFRGEVPTRYARRGHIPGSMNLPARSLLRSDGTPRGRSEVLSAARAAGIDLESAPEVWLYCGGGISAALAAAVLAHVGFTRVRIYDGSLEEWSAVPDLPLRLGPPTPGGRVATNTT
jgi:thiosulfate/3-mercaptopyruvate sulfurtransferase